jgi:hypothetical protein
LNPIVSIGGICFFGGYICIKELTATGFPAAIIAAAIFAVIIVSLYTQIFKKGKED